MAPSQVVPFGQAWAPVTQAMGDTTPAAAPPAPPPAPDANQAADPVVPFGQPWAQVMQLLGDTYAPTVVIIPPPDLSVADPSTPPPAIAPMFLLPSRASMQLAGDTTPATVTASQSPAALTGTVTLTAAGTVVVGASSAAALTASAAVTAAGTVSRSSAATVTATATVTAANLASVGRTGMFFSVP